jgi:uncharacterized membrane protein YgcG
VRHHHGVRSTSSLPVVLAAALLIATPALAQQTATCPPFEGVVCDGWVTDAAGVLGDDIALEDAAGRFVTTTGHEIAVVVVSTSGSLDPLSFAEGLGNTWGVGDPTRNDGIVVLIALAERHRDRHRLRPGCAISTRSPPPAIPTSPTAIIPVELPPSSLPSN